MKELFKMSAFCLLLVPGMVFSKARIAGNVQIDSQCGEIQTMVWLSQTMGDSETLLLHTLVPHLGSYAFSVKPGIYQVAAQTASGCEYENKEVEVAQDQIVQLDLELSR